MSKQGWIPGDPWIICDLCGFKTRMSQSLKTWDGLRVCKDDWSPKHPQLMVRGRVDRQAVIDGRPEPQDIFIDDGSGVDTLCQPSQVVPPITEGDLEQ